MDAINEITELISDLIRFRSMHQFPDEINACADYAQSYLEASGAPVQRIQNNSTPSILVFPESGFAPVFLMSHIDVVDGPDSLFSPFEKDGNLYGRGSYDDKYAVAVSLRLMKTALERMKKNGENLKNPPFGIVITGDEEIGGENGARAALRHIRSNFCIALDGGDLRHIVTQEKGIITARLVSKGTAAHGSRPWMGDNAIVKLFKDYEKLVPLFDIREDDNWRKTINFSMVQGGKSFNQVPDTAEALFDIRYTETDDVDALIAEMRSRTEGEIHIDTIEPVFSGGKTHYLGLLLKIAGDSAVGLEHGASDARFLSEYGIDGVVWGADGDLSQHCADEHVNIESVDKLYRMLDTFIGQAV